jgi:hypothetical protein
MPERLNAYRVSAGKAEGKELHGRPKCRWVDSIKMEDLKEIGWGGMDWICLAKDRNRWRAFVTAVMNLPVPKTAWNFLTS